LDGLTCRFRPFEVVDCLVVFVVDARALADRPDAVDRLAFAAIDACAFMLRAIVFDRSFFRSLLFAALIIQIVSSDLVVEIF
jgi:hypothetical protein